VDAYERGRPWLSDQPWEKLGVSIGYFFANFNSDVALTGAGAGVVLNFEDLLGLDSATNTFRISGHYRMWRRHHLHFTYYDVSRDAEQILEVSIPEVDPPIEAGALAKTNLDIRIYRIGYTFSFWNDNRVDLGAGLGFHVMDIGAGFKVAAEGSAGGEEGSFLREVLAEQLTAPLPVLMLRANVAITKRVFLKQSFEAFYINLSGFEGLLLDANIAVEGHICRFFGLGLGFNFMQVEIEGDGGDGFLGAGWNGKLNFDYSGLNLYGKFFF
jgi:hypothetical protein